MKHIYTTNKETTHSGFWPRTKENTYYGYKVGEFYYWWKTKSTVLKHLKGTNKEFHRATKIKAEMYINRSYLTLGRW